MRKLNQTSFARKPTKLVVLKGGHFAAALVLPLAVAQLAFGQAGPPPLPVQLPPRPAPPPPVTAPVPQVLAGHVPPRIAALGLTPMGPLPATQQLNLAIGLPLRNQQGLADFLVQLNDPESANYRRFLTSDEFAAAYGPAESDYESVIAFAQAQNLVVTATYSNRVLVDVIGSAADIERAFNVNLLLYQHPMEDRQFYAPEAEPSVDLSVPLLYISADDYVLPTPLSGGGSGTGGAFMGRDIRPAYVPGATAATGSGQSVALVEMSGKYLQADISSYESANQLPSPHPGLVTVSIDGYVGVPNDNGSEVALDIEMAIAMAPNLSTVFVYEGFFTDPAADILNRIATDDTSGQVTPASILGAPRRPTRSASSLPPRGSPFSKHRATGARSTSPQRALILRFR